MVINYIQSLNSKFCVFPHVVPRMTFFVLQCTVFLTNIFNIFLFKIYFLNIKHKICGSVGERVGKALDNVGNIWCKNLYCKPTYDSQFLRCPSLPSHTWISCEHKWHVTRLFHRPLGHLIMWWIRVGLQHASLITLSALRYLSPYPNVPLSSNSLL